MTPVIGMAGWGSAVLVLVLAGLRLRRHRRVLHRIAEAEHELRGPLTALGFALETPSSHRADPAARAAAQRAELTRARCALAMLTAARTGARPAPDQRAVDLADIARTSVTAWYPAAIAAGADLSAIGSDPVPVLADPARLAQATGNLIANAIRHGGGQVRVRTERAGSWARLEVTDGGPGIAAPRDVIGRAGHGGTHGHGLRVAARVAAEHGGELILTSAGGPSQTSGVALSFPLRPGT